jgi:hypothetical protein
VCVSATGCLPNKADSQLLHHQGSSSAPFATRLCCGLCRAEIVTVKVEDFQLREDHWVLPDLVGKGGHLRTVPIPAWVKSAVAPGFTLRTCRVESFSAPLGRVEEELCDGDCHQAACHGFRDRGPAAADRFYED